MAKLTKKDFKNLTPSRIGRMKTPELREILRGARQLFQAQENVFKRYEKNLYSNALDKMQTYYNERGKKAPSRANRQQLLNELFRLQEFFGSQSATVPGARKINLEQDKRIFGTDAKGKPLRRMTLEERTDFWASYNEFKSLKKESYIRNMGSNTIQQVLGSMVLESSKRGGLEYGFSAGDFRRLETMLEEQKALEDWETSNYEHGDSNTFSGKRPR